MSFFLYFLFVNKGIANGIINQSYCNTELELLLLQNYALKDEQSYCILWMCVLLSRLREQRERVDRQYEEEMDLMSKKLSDLKLKYEELQNELAEKQVCDECLSAYSSLHPVK